VLELCVGTIRDYAREKYKGPMPSEVDSLGQMATGLQYVHSIKLVHRDIKPANILIYVRSSLNPPVLKISDFGLSKPTTERGTFSLSGIRGTQSYMAPELFEWGDETLSSYRGSAAVDIFALGCVFYFYLTKGNHPFGRNFFAQPINILGGRYDLSG
jgi:serine/threonine protein kinase